MALPVIDYTTLTDLEVAQLKAEASLEEQRRVRVALAPAQAEAVAVSYLQDVGRTDGADWVQPEGAHDCYPLGYTVHKDGILWESLIPANVTVPGTDPRWWKDLTTVFEDGVWYPNSIVYNVGDVVTYNGTSYECLQAHTSQAGWEPSIVPALWKDLTPIPDQAPGLWDANGVSYAVDDLVTYESSTYKCLQAHTSQAGWTPAAVPALWQLV